MFQAPSHHCEYLDRKLIVVPVPLSNEEISKATSDVVNDILKESKQELAPAHHVAWRIGSALASFCGINNDVRHMSTLESAFRALGERVASVTNALRASFVEKEEPAWLGKEVVDFQAPGNRVFEFSERLGALLPIKDCNPTEALVLYTKYLEGKRDFWLKHFAPTYEPSADAEMPAL